LAAFFAAGLAADFAPFFRLAGAFSGAFVFFSVSDLGGRPALFFTACGAAVVVLVVFFLTTFDAAGLVLGFLDVVLRGGLMVYFGTGTAALWAPSGLAARWGRRLRFEGEYGAGADFGGMMDSRLMLREVQE